MSVTWPLIASCSHPVPSWGHILPSEPRRSLLLPHIMMCSPPCLCSHAPLHTSPYSFHLSQIYLSFETLLSYYTYQFSLSPQASSVWESAPGLWNQVQGNLNNWTSCKGRNSTVRNQVALITEKRWSPRARGQRDSSSRVGFIFMVNIY